MPEKWGDDSGFNEDVESEEESQKNELVGIDNEFVEDDFEDEINKVDCLQLDITGPQNTDVSINRSSGVVIGPVTHFNGQVIIYQNTNIPSSPTSAEGSPLRLSNGNDVLNGDVRFAQPPRILNSENHTPPTSKLWDNSAPIPKIRKYWHVGVFLLASLLAIIITISLLFGFNFNELNSIDEPVSIPSSQEQVTMETSPRIIVKSDWGGRDSIFPLDPLQHPIDMIIICHTGGKTCQEISQCSSMVQQIQGYQVEKSKLPDIGYNFLIGHDGNAYVGRGWDYQNAQKNGTISIAFMGNYIYDTVNDNQIKVIQELIDIGLKDGKIASGYKLVAHNQTSNTQSPGSNLYAVIKNLPNWTPGLFKQ